jgi:hypothetical protein
VCVRACNEHVTGDAREHAGLIVGDDGPVVLPCRQGDPAEFIEGEDVRAGNSPDALQWGPVETSTTASATSAAAIG